MSHRTLFLVCLAIVVLPGAGILAGDRYPTENLLEREAWWPHANGPYYGDVPDTMRDHPRVVRLPVGSFDSRAPGWSIPGTLSLSEEAGLKPGAPWLVQLSGPITDAVKQRLEAAGATIYRFHPVNTFLVRAEDPSRLPGVPGVLWAGPYHPAYRIEPELGQAPTVDPVKARNETIAVRARLFEPDDKTQVIEALQSLGAVINRESTYDRSDRPNRIYFTATPALILAAARMNEVQWVEESSTEAFPLNGESHLFMQTGSVTLGTPYWDAGIDGSTQIVGVMDTGMDVDTILMSHTATDAGTPGPDHRKVEAYSAWGAGDLTSCSATGYTHGTNVSQCAVANRSDFGLQSNFDGVARGARLVFQDIGTPGTCNLGPPNPMFVMYDEVRAEGGFLTNGSFVTCAYGSYGGSAFDLDQYGWDHREFLAFFSGGNGGGGNACPGTNKNHISSGGHYQEPFDNRFYGSYGPAPNGRVGPTVLGPACDQAGGNPPPINWRTSASIRSNDNDLVGIPAGDEGIIDGVCGTSFSSPYLMGAGALIRDYFEKGVWPSGRIEPSDATGISGAMVKATLINSGDFVDACIGCILPGLMGSMGMGRVNLTSTLALAGEPRTPGGTRIADLGMKTGLKTGEIYEEWIEVVDTEESLKVTVVWVDRPGSTLTNDLRLTVSGPDNTTAQRYFGNNFTTGAYSISQAAGGTDNDTTNVFEAVRINPNDLVPGVWKVTVRGMNVPMGDPLYGDSQPFALIASGGIDSLGIDEVSPIGEPPLRAVSSTATGVEWEWEPLADPTIDYALYRGTLTSLTSGVYDHRRIGNAHCEIEGSTTTVEDADDGVDSYYLVAGWKNGNSGPLGQNRPDADPECP